MDSPIARLILHPFLPCLLLFIVCAALPASGQEVKVEIAVGEVDPSMRDALVPPAGAEVTAETSESGELVDSPSPDATQEVPEPADTEDSAAHEAPEAAAPPAEVQGAAAESSISEMGARNLALGKELLAESRYLTIPGPQGSALNAFRKALAADPSNSEAQEGVQAIVTRLVTKANEAHADGNSGRARDLLRSAENIAEPFIDRSGIEGLKAAMASGETIVADNETTAAEAPLESAEESEPAKETAADPKVEAPAELAAAEKTYTEEAAPLEPEQPAISVAVAPTEKEPVATANEPVESLILPAVYHVGRRLRVVAPEGVDGALRWLVNESTVAEGGESRELDYVFAESDLGECTVRLQSIEKDGTPKLRAEGRVQVRLFEDNTANHAVGDAVKLDPRKHGPVEGSYALYAWRVDGEDVSSEPTLDWTFNEPGNHRIECRMTGPQSEADQQWPAPVLAWRFNATAAGAAAAVHDDAAVTRASEVTEVPDTAAAERQSSLLLVTLGAAVIVLALSQAWMAHRLNVLTRASGFAKPATPGPTAPTIAALGTLPPEDETMEELHQRFRSNEAAPE